MGISIGKVFKPIEMEMKKYAEVEHIYLPYFGYRLKSLIGNIRVVIQKINDNEYDLIHITGTEHYLLPFLRRNKTIVTVHDLGFYTNKKRSLKSAWKYFCFIKTLKFAKAAVFISEKSKIEALNIVSLKNIYVINNCVPPEISFSNRLPSPLPKILHIGTNPHKNLDRVIESLKNLSIELYIVGKLSTENELKLKNYSIKYHQFYNISDQLIAKLYANSDIISFPSLSEGFGMPIIEGQAAGRIVVTSNLSPMKEVAGGGAILVNPYDIESIKEGFLMAIQRPQHIIDLGLENIKKYSIKSIVDKYFKLYTDLLNNGIINKDNA